MLKVLTFSQFYYYLNFYNDIQPRNEKVAFILEGKSTFFVCVCVFLLFLGPLPRHMEVPRLGVKLEL